MRETVPSLAVEGSAMMALPPCALAAPRLKSTWPPTPEKNFVPSESAQTWPVRSISSAVLIATILCCWLMIDGSLTYSVGWNANDRVVVDVVVELARAEAEAGHDLAAVQRLARAGDDAGLDQVNDAVGEHLGVDAEVFLVLQERQQRLRNAPDAQLDRGAVLDQRGDVFGDLPGLLGVLRVAALRGSAPPTAPARQCRRRG